jgi:hypothetical protein
MRTRKIANRMLMALIALAWACSANAQQRGYSGLTAADIAEEQEACAADAERFCGGNVTFLFEMESCLSRYISKISKECRSYIRTTDFRQYHNDNPLD